MLDIIVPLLDIRGAAALVQAEGHTVVPLPKVPTGKRLDIASVGLVGSEFSVWVV
jgi:hypothetical protein